MSEDKISHYRKLAITYIPNLITDHTFFLNKVQHECSESLRDWQTSGAARSNHELNAYFSAYISSFQSIRDTASLASNTPITWNDLLGDLGSFIYSLRNAITHNGMSMLELWIDGRFFFSAQLLPHK